MRSGVPVGRGPVPRRAKIVPVHRSAVGKPVPRHTKIVPFHRSAGACPPRFHSSGAGLARYEQDLQDFQD